MISGKVDQSLQARVALQLMGGDGRLQPVEVVLDTGFDEDLTMPPDMVQQLDLTPEDKLRVVLANGEEVSLDSWSGMALWHDRMHPVLVLQADGEPLLGMRLLQGSRVTLDVLDDGDVAIEGL